MLKINYEEKINDLIENMEKYHKKFYDKNKFTGPSLYFHKKALEIISKEDIAKHLEYVYAVLVAWGMHRMGSSGAKMNHFNVFRDSLDKCWDKIIFLRKVSLNEIEKEDVQKELKVIFDSIKIMDSSIKLIAHSKVLAHLVPNLIPPIDREYTLFFLRGKKYVPKKEWDFFNEILIKFFLPIAINEKFKNNVIKWRKNKQQFDWDTSIPKIIDNLIIGAKEK